jgi:hypothetical protein
MGLDSLEERYEEAGRLFRLLDEMGFGEWQFEHTAGGCYLYRCELSDGSLVLVTGDDVLGPIGDPLEFGSSVTVGFYRSEDAYLDGDFAEMVGALLVAPTAEGVAVAVFEIMSGRVCSECGAGKVSCGFRWWDGVLGELVLSVVCGDCADVIRADDPEIEFESVIVSAW